MRTRLICLPLVFWSSVAVGQADPDFARFSEARELSRRGDRAGAFLKFLAIPGAEHAAVLTARPRAAEFLKVLRDQAGDVPAPRAKLVEGDLLLANGKRAEALECYRQVVAGIATAAAGGPAQRLSPGDSYPVEPPTRPGGPEAQGPSRPFTEGPGSHRDNWLIRRFIALEAWEDAGREFARVWEIHRRNAAPYVATWEGDDGKPRRALVRPTGFDGRGLQFALDYAYFLKRRRDSAGMLAVLTEPLLVMDLDRDPNHPTPGDSLPEGKEVPFPARELSSLTHGRSAWGSSAGTSRKEYLRLAFGEFKAAGGLDPLVGRLEAAIGRGENRARRVLARVRMLQGRPDDSLAQELAYIDAARFDPLTTSYRRGVAYEEAGKIPEATAAFEKALASPYVPPTLPDQEEATAEGPSAALRSSLPPGTPAGKAAFRAAIADRLQRLYAATGRVEKALDLTLRQFDEETPGAVPYEALARADVRFKAAGQGARFLTWARNRLDRTKDPMARAVLHSTLGDEPGTILDLVAAVKQGPFELGPWKDRFREAGKDHLRSLLAALIEANPDDLQTRMEWLDLADRVAGPEALKAFEAILEARDRSLFRRGRGGPPPTRFRNVYDFARRLMRLYEKAGEREKLVALGFRILEGKPPFERPGEDAVLPTPRVDWNQFGQNADLVDLLSCVDVMLPHATKPEDVRRLADLAARSDCTPLKNQVAKLSGADRTPRIDPAETHRRRYDSVEVSTPGLPPGVRMLTNRDDVRALSADGRWVGTSWGLVRYDEGAGRALRVLQIPLGVRVTTFEETPAGLFVGTAAGLYRLDRPDGDTPSPARIDLDAVIPAGPFRRDLRVEQLLWLDGALWVAEGNFALRYDPKTREARFFEEARGKLSAGAGRLWAQQAVFDPESGEFTPLRLDPRPWRVVGVTGSEVWADILVNDTLRHRPALIDPKTLAFRILSISDPSPGQPLLINSEFEVVAEDPGYVWLGAKDSNARFVYDRKAGQVRTVAPPESNRPAAHVGPAVWPAPGARGYFARQYCGSATVEPIPGLVLQGDRGPVFCWRERPGGTLLLGSGIVREWGEDNLGFDDNSGMSHHVQDLEGGLFAVDERTLAWQKLGAGMGELTDFYVKRIAFDDKDRRAYVCTNGGVTVLTLPDGDPVGKITVSDGLPSNKVEDVARIGNKLYLACELGDHAGGLAVLDLPTGLIQTLTVADGLACDKVKRLRAEGDRLHILYGAVYGPRSPITKGPGWVLVGQDQSVLGHPSSILDTTTGAIVAGREILPAPAPPDESNRLPVLGGAVLVDVTHGGKRFLGGTHGLLVLDDGAKAVAAPRLVTEPVVATPSPRQRQLAEARAKPARVSTPAELADALRGKNPFARASAVASLLREGVDPAPFLPALIAALDDPEPRVRGTALYFVGTSKGEDTRVVPALTRRQDDPDPTVRDFATVYLADRGLAPSLRRLRQVFEPEENHGSSRNLPFGADSTLGIAVGADRLYEAVAPWATPDVFAVLIEHPLQVNDGYEPRVKIFNALGSALRKHPEAAAVLLPARDRPDQPGRRVPFVQAVFKAAGRDLLPALHKALASDDRVIRSNAARACGAIGDPSSIPPLLKALEFESGLSRASVVWALGELKAGAALPRLVALYVDFRGDEPRSQRGAGYRTAQAAAVMVAQYETLGRLDVIGAEWDELKASLVPAPADTLAGEDLLTRAEILDAVRKIGPAASQEFYRTLAADRDTKARVEAATWLDGADPGRNLPILRNLLADDSDAVRMAAAVSLLRCGRDEARAPILRWLGSPHVRDRASILRQLARVDDPDRLAFARPKLEAIAAEPGPDNDRLRAAALSLLRRDARPAPPAPPRRRSGRS